MGLDHKYADGLIPETVVSRSMMLPTHVVVGVALAAPLLVVAPELAPAALLGALVGSVLPDLDLYAGHRQSLHYPTGYPIAAGLVALPTLGMGSAVAVGAAFLLVSAAVHCRMDRYGGGLELRPWEGTSERAVYDHVQGRWRAPKRWIRYDGAPEDLLLVLVVGSPLLVVLDGPFQLTIAAALVVAVTYTALRRWLADLAPAVFSNVPKVAEPHVPDRYVK